MARAAPIRASRRSVTSHSNLERTARRWYTRRRRSIVQACWTVLLVLLSVAVCFFVFRKHLVHESQELPDSARTTSGACSARLGDSIDSIDPLYRPILPVGRPAAPFPVLRDALDTSAECLEDWLYSGEAKCGSKDWKHAAGLDLVWTWVNGSDPRWKDEMQRAAREEGIFSPGFHYREQNELQYSMRSVVSALGDAIRAVHLVVSDFPHDNVNDRPIELDGLSVSTGRASNADFRVAQTPRWLDSGLLSCRNDTPDSPRPPLQLVTHYEIFHQPSRIDGSEEGRWRNLALPSFNSKVIESRLGWIPRLDEHVLSFNDDFFLLQPHTLSDFYSTLYGTMIRFDDGFYQQVRPILDKKNLNDAGETGGLWHANYVLSKRFPKRLRPYLPHVPKAVTRGLHHEAALMFEKDLYISTQRQFRESKRGVGDIQMQWLLISLRVERWREALLWTFIVAKLGDRHGLLGSDAKRAIDQTLGAEGADHLEIVRGPRLTLEKMHDSLSQAELQVPAATEVLFSSMDGHLPPIPRPGDLPTSSDKCTLNLDDCFGSFWTSGDSSLASEVFKRVAFERPACGDCLIMALVTASGPLGLSAFMPDHTVFVNKATTTPTHHTPLLPMTDTWQAADFSLESVIRDTEMPGAKVDLRRYTSRLLSRYLYTSGRSKTQFHMIDSPEHAARAFAEIDSDPQAAMLGLNDNIQRDEAETGRVMTSWMQQRWPKAVWWERPK